MIETLLFATDFSPLSARAEAYAAQLAQALGARLEIVHAITPIDGPEDDEELARFGQELRERAEARLEAIVGRLRGCGIDASSFLASGAPWEVIIERADEIGADMVILGSHGLRDRGRVYVGTTSHRVLFNTTAPVLVVRPEHDEAH